MAVVPYHRLRYGSVADRDTRDVTAKVDLPSPYVWSGATGDWGDVTAELHSWDAAETEREISAASDVLITVDGSDSSIATVGFQGVNLTLFGNGSTAAPGRYRVELWLTSVYSGASGYADWRYIAQVWTIDII